MVEPDDEVLSLLERLAPHAEEIDAANWRVVSRMQDAQPFLVDVVPAKEVIPELAGEQKLLLHAGPPVSWQDMCAPMQGSCIGAALFEGWASSEAEARELLASGEVAFKPNHETHAVGPMSGITAPDMAVLVVENRLDGTRAYCSVNEGGGNVLRFGAFGEEVSRRLWWMTDVLAPVLSAALRSSGGLNVSVMMAKAIAMGDDFHMRNAASSLVLLKELLPLIVGLDWDDQEKSDVIDFVSGADQFFLNLVMATGKAIVDCARKVEEGCVVTTLCRNGRDFGIRISGLGDAWFCAPVTRPRGLYFTGYSERDANPDIGDSAICETIGVGGMAMVASPAVTRFLGAGGMADARRYSEEGERICITHNPNWTIPIWDFKGTNLGIDLRKVMQTGITPTINTAIANREAGHGMVGAGTAQAPYECFKKALAAYVEKLDQKRY